MTNLEKYIRDHQEDFDSMDPEPGHFRRFEDRLQGQPALKHAGHNSSMLLKIAALIIILITVSVAVFDFATREIRERFASGSKGSELPFEIREVVQYYNNQTITRIATLSKLAAGHEDGRALNASALTEIKILDASTEELKKSLSGNPGNEQILDAIIRNQQMKETMLNTIISQVSQFKK